MTHKHEHQRLLWSGSLHRDYPRVAKVRLPASSAVVASMDSEGRHTGPEPPGQVEPAPPVILRRRQLAADDGSLQLDAPPAPVDVTPLKRTTLASAHSRAE